jgi:hypothetical protein
MGKETFHIFPPSAKNVASTLIKDAEHFWHREGMDAVARGSNIRSMATRTA